MAGENLDAHLGELEAQQEFNHLFPIYQAFERMEESPADNDPRIAAFSRAACFLILHEPRFREAISDTIDFRQERDRPAPPPYIANLCLRAAQHMLRQGPDYSSASLTMEGWVHGITHLLDRADNENDTVSFPVLLMTQEIQTVVDARYKAAQLYVAINPKKFPKPIKYLDLGTSAGTGAKAFAAGQIKHRIGVNQVVPADRQKKINKIAPAPKGWLYPEAALQSDKDVNHYVRHKLGVPINFEIAVGADIIDPEDEAAREWIKSCYYPSEIAENKNNMISKFDYLAQFRLDNWRTLRQIDCSDPDAPDRIRAESGVGEYDLITVFTMLGQLTESERVQTIQNALKLLAPGGTLLESDFAKTTTSTPSGLEMYDTWYPYTYRTAEYNTEFSHWEDVFWWSSGRCSDVIIAPTANFLTSATTPELMKE